MIDKSKVAIAKPPQPKAGPQGGDQFAMEERIYFAALALQNVQELNARADAKAYLVLTANGFLIAFMGVAAPAYKNIWQHGLTLGALLHAGATASLILTVAVSLLHAFRIISPRLKPQSKAMQVEKAELIFFVDILRAHPTDQAYTQALLNATPEELLANLSSSTYGASVSAQEKYREAHLSIRALRAVLVAWVVFVLLTFVLE